MSERIGNTSPANLTYEERSDDSIFEQLDTLGYRVTGSFNPPAEFSGQVKTIDRAPVSEPQAETNSAQTLGAIPAILDAADAAATALNQKGPYNIATTDAIERSVQRTLVESPAGGEKELIACLGHYLTEKTDFRVAIAPSQFSVNRMMVTLNYKGREQIVRFSVSKRR